jgi:transcriptional regulator with XRE-family HTH domain
MIERIDTANWGNAKPGSTLATVDDYAAVVAALRARKRALSLSSAEIAARCGLGESYVRKILTGSKILGPLTLPLMLAVLGLRIAVLAAETPRPGVPKRNHSEAA